MEIKDFSEFFYRSNAMEKIYCGLNPRTLMNIATLLKQISIEISSEIFNFLLLQQLKFTTITLISLNSLKNRNTFAHNQLFRA